AERGHEDHREVGACLASPRAEIDAALVGEPDVGDHDVDVLARDDLAGAGAAVLDAHVEPGATEPQAEQVANALVVIDDQDPTEHRRSRIATRQSATLWQ